VTKVDEIITKGKQVSFLSFFTKKEETPVRPPRQVSHLETLGHLQHFFWGNFLFGNLFLKKKQHFS